MPLRDGATDDPERRERLARTLRELRTVFERSPVGLAVLDRDATVDRVNRRFAALLELEPDEVRGRDLSALVAHEGLRRLVRQVVGTGQAQVLESVTLHRHGEDRVVELHLEPVPENGHAAERIVCAARDITLDLRANETLIHADHAKNEFLAVLGHELRNPLASIRNGIALLETVPDDGWALGMMKDSVRTMVSLLDDLLDLERVTLGKLELVLEPCDLEAIVRQTAQAFARDVAARDLDVEVQSSGESMMVDGDRTRLEQLASNLLSNAVKFSADGAPIHVVLKRTSSEVALEVIDQGIGIEPNHLTEVFDPFVQEHASRSGQGLGIGLALVRQLADIHGGTVEAISEGRGRGATFRLVLPRSAAGNEVRAAPAGHDEAREGSEKLSVLVVDDNEASTRALIPVLNAWGHDARSTPSAEAALTLLETWRPDVLCIDIGLPGMNGYELAQHLRRDFVSLGPLIAVTGYGHEAARRQALESGFDRHLTKPVNLSELRELLADVGSRSERV